MFKLIIVVICLKYGRVEKKAIERILAKVTFDPDHDKFFRTSYCRITVPVA